MTRNIKGQFVTQGRIIRSGYWYLFKPDHPFASKQGHIAEHRVVMEFKIGRYLKPSEAVHHIDHDKTNNHINNLQLFSSHGQHTKLAHPEVYEKARQSSLGRKPPNYNRGTIKCLNCPVEFETTLGTSGKKFCTKACFYASRKGVKPTNMDGLKLGRGWNKGQPATWVKKGKESHSYRHGRYSQ